MKNWIKQQIRESLDEIAPVHKKPFGKGAFHKVYSSLKFPDKLFKIGEKNVVEQWVAIFKKYPKYFPKVYRVFPYSKAPNYFVVEIEKLNTKQAELDYELIDEFLFEYSDKLSCSNEFLGVTNFFESRCFGLVEDQLNETNNSELIPLFNKWATFLREAYPIIEGELDTENSNRYLDLHSGNVAYDKRGNIKFIDI